MANDDEPTTPLVCLCSRPAGASPILKSLEQAALADDVAAFGCVYG